MVNSGTPGRTLLPSSYHEQGSGRKGAGTTTKQPLKSKKQHQHQTNTVNAAEKRAAAMHSSPQLPPPKRSKLSNAASAAAAASPMAGQNGMARGMYLAFVDNAIAEKKQVSREQANHVGIKASSLMLT